MFAFALDLESRLFGILLGLSVGTLVAWLTARWRLARAKRSLLAGNADDLLVIELQLVERHANGTIRFRRRYLGQQPVAGVIANPHLALEFRKRAGQASKSGELIAMDGAAGSYLLECMAGFVGDRVGNAPFDHAVYVMAPCRDPDRLSHHKSLGVILISQEDLELFLSWPKVQRLEVEHAADAVRLLTLMELARRWRDEQAALAQHRAAGKSTRHQETMFLMDLALDRRSAELPTRAVPWARYRETLATRNLPLTADALQSTIAANPDGAAS
jgi:hypothetical protein